MGARRAAGGRGRGWAVGPPPGHHALLARLEEEHGVGPLHAFPVLRDVGVRWRVHLPLVDPRGNWGSVAGDPHADPRYTEVRLSPLGALALASERGEAGPAPFGLVDGSLYRGGLVPPLGLGALAAVRALVDDPDVSDRALRRMVGPLTVPSGGVVEGRLTGLYAGRRARLHQACRFVHEHDDAGARLVIAGVPLGVRADDIMFDLANRLDVHRRPRYRDYLPEADRTELPEAELAGVVDIVEETRAASLRIVVRCRPGADLDAVEAWARTVWPAVVPVELRLPAPLGELLRGWADACRADRSGLDRLTALAGGA